jgi:hypothetical protein
LVRVFQSAAAFSLARLPSAWLFVTSIHSP